MLRAAAMKRVAVWCAIAALSSGCYAAHELAPCPGTDESRAQVREDADGIDLLFVIDRSSAMAGFEDLTAAAIERAMLRAATGDLDGDGVADARPEAELRAVVVDMDVGSSACAGDQAVLHTVAASASSGASCPASATTAQPAGSLLATFTGDSRDGARFAHEVACAARVGASGCPFVRGFDAIRAAMDPAAHPGLFRPSARLIVTIITARDDCSSDDASVYSDSSPPELRCHAVRDRLADPDAAARALVAGRDPGQVFVELVAGFPLQVWEIGGNEMLLARSEMQEQIAPDGDHLVPACTSANGGHAEPGRRWIALANALTTLGASVQNESVCDPPRDDGRSWDRDLDWTITAVNGRCLPSTPALDAAGRPRCDVLFVVPAGHAANAAHCSDLAHPEAFVRDGVEQSAAFEGGPVRTREICRLRQLPPGTDEAGWSFGAASSSCTNGLLFRRVVASGAEVRTSCRAAPPSPALGSPCDPATGLTTSAAVACASLRAANGATLVCDPYTRACELPCLTDADCAGAGEAGWLCDQRDAWSFFGGAVPAGLPFTRGACIDPICDPFRADH